MGSLRISAHIADDRQAAVRRCKSLWSNEGRDLCAEVNAVDENIDILDDFPEGTACNKC